jgi:predicted permease
VWLPRSRYPENEQQTIFFERFLEKLKSIPAVKEAAAIQDLPLRRNRMAYEVQLKGKPTAKNEEKEIAYRTFAGNYFRLMGISVIKGRAPANLESAKTMPVVWINKTAAETFWPGEDAIGKNLRFAEEERWLTVAGVVNDVKHMGVENEEGPALYQPHAQKTFSFLSWMTVIVQVDGSAETVVPLIRSQLHELDPNQPLFEITSLEKVFEKATERSRFSTILLSIFALFAVFLACCGIFSIVQYSVAQRTREIGIRMALGARNQEIISLFFKEGLMLVFGAIVPGVIVSVLLLPLVRSFMYQVQAAEIPTAAVSVFLIFVAVFAAIYFPARRAARLDVVSALRCE